ncbi:MAG: hypothetical protein ACPGGD_05110 [Thalassolituus sp.]|jgi:hypothetical protein|nr:MAG: hypothetical protein COA68_00865 [Oceanobacter sp.]|tara:strand:+ start:370 stop:861 length:492 start_codon:yes stop_codon:yes gene_type:complete
MAKPSLQSMVSESPLPGMVKQLGVSIAEAQFAMDQTSLSIAKAMADPDIQGLQLGGPDSRKYCLLELGFTPTFYQMTNVTIEAKIAMSMGSSTEFSVGASISGGIGFFAASVNASYSNKYSYEASASSSIITQLTAIPPPPLLQEKLQAQLKERQQNSLNTDN